MLFLIILLLLYGYPFRFEKIKSISQFKEMLLLKC